MKQVFITGADRGIGLALTEEFLSHGYMVYAGRYLSAWKELDRLKQKYPESLVLIPLDVSNTESVKSAYEETRKLTDHLDILVNVAGILKSVNAENLKHELIEKYIPALAKGHGKRIGFVSYRYASISDNQDTADYALHMDAAEMSMQAKMVHEKLRNLKSCVWVLRCDILQRNNVKRNGKKEYQRHSIC